MINKWEKSKIILNTFVQVKHIPNTCIWIGKLETKIFGKVFCFFNNKTMKLNDVFWKGCDHKCSTIIVLLEGVTRACAFSLFLLVDSIKWVI